MTQTSEAVHEPVLAVTGIKVFLASEAMFFLLLILAYFYLRANTNPAALGNLHRLNPLRTGIFTVCLVASSGTVWLAGRAQQRGRAPGLWLAITLLLGLVFLAGQLTEYLGLLAQNWTIASDVLGTQFYTLTGLHFLHVTAGAVALAILCLLTWRGTRLAPSAGAVESVSLYWHFVDVVWIFLYPMLYLVSRAG